MVLGDGIRRNIAHVEPNERMLLRDAIKELHNRNYPGSRDDPIPGGVSWWFKQDEVHQATHVHGGPEFLPWHREFTNRFEALIRVINPQLSVHYWDFSEDPTNIIDGNLGNGATGQLNLFDENFMGTAIANPTDHDDPSQFSPDEPNVDAGAPWLGARFYDPLAGQSGHLANRDATKNPVDPPPHMIRTKHPLSNPLVPEPMYPIINLSDTGAFPPELCPNLRIHNDSDIIGTNLSFPEFRVRLECVHNFAHTYIADVDPHHAFRDPLVFLLHSNVDRIFARWQTDPAHPERLDPNTIYGSDTNLNVTVDSEFGLTTQNLSHNVEPWSTGLGRFATIRPWAIPADAVETAASVPNLNQALRRQLLNLSRASPHDYYDNSVVAPRMYETNGQPPSDTAPGWQWKPRSDRPPFWTK